MAQKESGGGAAAGGWETVGKVKKPSVGGKSTANGGAAKKTAAGKAAEKKRFEENAPKVEDVLPMSQVSAMYSASIDLQGGFSVDGGSSGGGGGGSGTDSPKSSGDRRAAKAAQSAKDKKAAADKKRDDARKPKSLQEAAKNISTSELKSILASVMSSYPENQLLWLRDAATYLNVCLVTDPSLSTSSTHDLLGPIFGDGPLALLTKESRRALTQLLEQCDEAARQTGFENFIVNTAHDLAKGLSVNGYLVLLQLMSEIYPNLCTFNAGRFVELRNSYQNRPQICTVILWALGQGGRKDLAVGLKVWLEYMLPVLTMRHYSKFVVDYLVNLLAHHPKPKSSPGPRVLYPSQFFLLFDAIFIVGPNALHKDVQAQLARTYVQVKDLSIGDCGEDHELFPEFMSRLSSASPPSVAQRRELLTGLMQCLSNNDAALSHWHRMYTSHLVASAELLAYIVQHWKTASSSLDDGEMFYATIHAFQEYNHGAAIQKDGIGQCTSSCEVLLKKMNAGSSGSGWFPWKTGCLVLLLAIAGVLNHDIEKHGSFEAARAGLFLRDVGLYSHATSAWETTAHYGGIVVNVTAKAAGDASAWTSSTLPVALDFVSEHAGRLRDAAAPYALVAWDKLHCAFHCVADALPGVLDKAQVYWPAVQAKFSELYDSTLLVGTSAWAQTEAAAKWIAVNSGVYADKVGQAALAASEAFVAYSVIVWEFVAAVLFSLKQVMRDVIDGKIDLTDVSQALQRAFRGTTDYAIEVYRWVLNQADVIIK